jgi:hypothetical protein
MSVCQSITTRVVYKSIDRIPGHWFGEEGSVWSERQPGGQQKAGVWHRRIVRKHKNGYWRFNVYIRGKQICFWVHLCVLEAFRGPRPHGLEACHGPDPNTDNNRIDNLRWDTKEANVSEKRPRAIGVAPFTKLTPAHIPDIRRRLTEGESRKSIARSLGVHYTTISYIASGKLWAGVA